MKKYCTTCRFEPEWTMDFQWVDLKCKQTSVSGNKLKVLYYFEGHYIDITLDTKVVFKSVDNFDSDIPQLVHDCNLWEAK